MLKTGLTVLRLNKEAYLFAHPLSLISALKILVCCRREYHLHNFKIVNFKAFKMVYAAEQVDICVLADQKPWR